MSCSTSASSSESLPWPNLAPTTSTTAALVMGDALAAALIQLRGFRVHQDDFAQAFTRAASLGRKRC